MSAAEAVAQVKDGMTVGIGGWGPRRKPMALVRELLRSPVRDLTLVSYGGADVGMLCAAGKVRKLVFAFVSLVIGNLGLIFANRSRTLTILQSLRTPNKALWWITGGAIFFLVLVLALSLIHI